MKVLFLDIDGVLNSIYYSKKDIYQYKCLNIIFVLKELKGYTYKTITNIYLCLFFLFKSTSLIAIKSIKIIIFVCSHKERYKV